MEPTSAHAEYIVYACPVGPLATQIARYMEASRDACGPNAAHRYLPHCTLIGFFHDEPGAAGRYVAALAQALQCALPSQPPQALRVVGLELSPDFHGLLLDGPWLKELVADFAQRALSTTRRDALRLKGWLHLSLAYEFPPEHHETLAGLARDLVDATADVRWQLRLYERHADGTWTCHAGWWLEE